MFLVERDDGTGQSLTVSARRKRERGRFSPLFDENVHPVRSECRLIRHSFIIGKNRTEGWSRGPIDTRFAGSPVFPLLLVSSSLAEEYTALIRGERVDDSPVPGTNRTYV